MEVRVATTEDAAGIARVRVAAWQHGYAELIDPQLLAELDVDEDTARWRERLTGGPSGEWADLRALVAEHDGRVLAFAVLRQRTREADLGPTTAELAALYVHPVVQGAGLGTTLLDRVHGVLRELGATDATLRVLAGNEWARGFYRGRGWAHDPDAPPQAFTTTATGPTERWTRRL